MKKFKNLKLSLSVVFLMSTAIAFAQGLNIQMDAFPNPVKPGDVLSYVITISNTSPNNFSNIKISTLVPDFVDNFYSSEYGADGGYSSSGDLISWSSSDLQSGQSKTVMYTVTLRSSNNVPDNTTLSSTATVTSSESSASTNFINILVKHDRKLSLMMTQEKNPIEPGGTIRYHLLYANSGTTTLTNVVLTASIPDGTAFSNASGGGVESNGVVTWNLGTLETNSNGQLIYEVTVDNPLPKGTILYSSAEITTSSSGGQTASTDISTIVKQNIPLKLSFNSSPNPVKPGDIINFQLTITNTTNEDIANVYLESIVPNYVKNFYSNEFSAEGGYSSPGDLIYWTISNLHPGQSKTRMYSVTLLSSNNLPDNTILTSLSVVGASGISASTNSTNVLVKHDRKLSLMMTQEKNPIEPGGTIRYHLLYANSGTTTLTNVVLTASIPDGTAFSNASGGGVESNGVVTWNLGTLETNSNGQLIYEVTVDNPLPKGTILYSSAEITTSSSGGQTASTDISTVVKQNIPILLSCSVSSIFAKPSSTINFQLTLTNTTNEDLTNVYLKSIVPDYVKNFYSSDFGAEGGYSSPGDLIYWIFNTIPSGQSKTVLYSLTVLSSSYVPDNTIISNYSFTSDAIFNSSNSLVNLLINSNSPTSIEDEVENLPEEFILYQNYPNPFNPSTIIKYGIPEQSNIKIEIFDMLGQSVGVLVNGNKSAGYFEIIWKADNLPSGIYFFSISTKGLDSKKSFRKVRKALLLK